MGVRKPELLSPAGDMKSLFAAVSLGADAVYIGGKGFSARQYAGNFTKEELCTAIDYCHIRGVKVYITVNTLYKDFELKEALDFVNAAYEAGADAFILQDLGLARILKESFPDILLSASTQLTAGSAMDVKFLENFGFKKVILSRELSLPEIEEISKNVSADLEVFVHGALCFSYSGKCLLSSILGGRSGNRGRCAQPCRLSWELYQDERNISGGYLLSPKDIETLKYLPELISAGVSSFKIEGRMKSAEYVAGTTLVYRKYIDKCFGEEFVIDPEDRKILLRLFNRGGFSDGYLKTHSGKDMMSDITPKSLGLMSGFVDSYDKKHKRLTIRTREPFVPGDGIEIWTKTLPHPGKSISKPSKAGEIISLTIEGYINKNDPVYKTYDKALIDDLNRMIQKDSAKTPVFVRLKAKKNENISLSIRNNSGLSVTVSGNPPETAKNRPLSKDELKRQVEKTGGTSLVFDETEIEADEDIFIPISEINDLRRKATSAFEEKLILKSKRKGKDSFGIINKAMAPVIMKKKLNVLVSSEKQLEAALLEDGINIMYFEKGDISPDMAALRCHKKGVKAYAALPEVLRQNEDTGFINKLIKSDIDGFLVRTLGEFLMVKDSGKEIAVDSSLNIFNKESLDFWQSAGSDITTLSLELNLNEIKELSDSACEIIGYGHIPLMITHQCPVGAYAGEKNSGKFCSLKGHKESYYLKDRKSEVFPLLTDCERCICTILNGKPIFILKFFDEILKTPAGYMRLSFTLEDAETTRRVISAYSHMISTGGRAGKEDLALISEMGGNKSTKGHYYRGVE